MKNTIALLLAPLLMTACSHQAPHSPLSVAHGTLESARHEVLRLNREIFAAMIRENDPALFLAHSQEDFLVIAPGGIIENREEAAAGARNFDAIAVSMSDEQVRIVGGTAVVIGRLEIDGEVRPLGRPGPARFMTVFVQQSSEWKLLARSVTPCARLAIERGRC